MVMVSSMGEARSTPSYPSMASPRYGGCVSSFLHFFDWTPAKRLSSTKRLSGSKPEKAFRRSRSFHSDNRSAGKTRMMCQSGGNSLLDQVPDGTRAPGVVARLMGLESLPQPPRHRRSQSYSGGEPLSQNGTPILLQDLLKRDYKTSKRSLKDRIPIALSKRTPQEESNRFRKKSVSVWTAFRCRPEVSCVSPAYIDIPSTSRFLYAVARSPRSPFLSRLPPGSQLQTSQESSSMTKPANHLLEEKIPELSLQASSTGSTVLLQGWPLESQHIVPPDIFHESDYEPAVSTSSLSVGSRPTDSASSKPLMAVGSHKVVQRRRRGSSWNGSEDSESTIEQDVQRKPARVGRGGLKKVTSPLEELVSSPRHRNSRNSEPAFKTTRRPASSKSSANPITAKRDPDRQPLMLQVENSRTLISQELISAGSLGSVSSEAPTALAGKSKASNTGRAGRVDFSSVATTEVKSKEDDERRLGKILASSHSRFPSRSKEMAPRKPPPKVRNRKGVMQQENSVSRVFPAGSPSKGSPSLVERSGDFPDGVNLPKVSYGIRLFGGRKEGDKPLVTKKKGDFSSAEVKIESRVLEQQHASPTLQRFTEKTGGVCGKQTTKRDVPRLSSESTKLQVQDLGDRLKTRNMNEEDMAIQSSAARDEVKVNDNHGSTTLRSNRRNKFQSKHARARSVDDVFPELPLEFENSKVDSKEKSIQTDRESLSLNRPVDRVLFGQGFSSSPEIGFYTDCKNGFGDQISSSPLVDFSTGACMLGRLSVSLVDYDELPCSGDYGKEAGLLKGLSGSPLIDCDELCSLGEEPRPASTSAEDELIHTEAFHAQEDGGFAIEVDGLRWEDEIVETSTLSGRCCERSCSGPSISSESLPSDVDPDIDDERNADTWSSCASHNNLGDCHSPRVFEVTEIDVEPVSLNQEHQNSPPTQFVKKILDPTGLDPLVDELAGQPSPVSVLDSPFHDEACTTSESSLTDSTYLQLNSEEIMDDVLQPSSPTTIVSNSDKIRQALLDISMFRNREESCPFEAQTLPKGDTKDERSFIQGVLSAAHFLSTPGSSPNWHDKDVAIDPSLFDKLESGDIVEFSCQASGGLWRCDRKLLFDCVNEAFGLTRLWHCQGGQEVWLQEELVWRSSLLRGELLVVEVVKKIEEWRKLASYAIDSLIERDMSVHSSNWKRFGPEVAEVGLNIESTVWGAILEELVVDMIVSTSKRYQF